MKPFFWTKIPQNRLPQWWRDLSDEKVQLNTAELEQLFPMQAPKKSDEATEDKKKSAPTNAVVSLLDPRRTNNIGNIIASSSEKLETRRCADFEF